jgi:hypothetical protein
MGWKGFRRKRSWPVRDIIPALFWTMKNVSEETPADIDPDELPSGTFTITCWVTVRRTWFRVLQLDEVSFL